MTGKRARRGDPPSTAVLRQRFDDLAADRIARLIHEAGIPPDEVAVVSIRAVDGMHEVIVDTGSSGPRVVGRVPVLAFATDYGDLADEYLRELAGRVELRRGRRPGLTTITDDAPLRTSVAEMDREGRRVTRETLAAHAAYTLADIRGYLRYTNRSFAELLADLRHPH